MADFFRRHTRLLLFIAGAGITAVLLWRGHMLAAFCVLFALLFTVRYGGLRQ